MSGIFSRSNILKSHMDLQCLAICCLVIETLESFYQGKSDTKSIGAKIFSDFFFRDARLKMFSSEENWFFKEIRCGILHQSETRGGWKVLRSGPVLDNDKKAINANALMQFLKESVQEYAIQLAVDQKVWRNFRKKMNAVCANCSTNAA